MISSHVVDGCHYPDFVYIKAIRTSVAARSYEGKSLEEIRDQYGDQVAQNVYWCAAHGNDLTRPVAHNYHIVENCIDLEISTDIRSLATEVFMFILPNEFTVACEKLCVLSMRFHDYDQYCRDQFIRRAFAKIYGVA